MRLTPRDEAILAALAFRVRLFAVEQVAATWWPDAREPIELATRRLRALDDGGWLVRLRVQSRATPQLDRPVLAWRPGDRVPRLDEVSRRLIARWQGPTRGVQAVVLGPVGGKHFGVSRAGRLKYDFQATHDLGVAQMYLTLRKHHPEKAALWIGEDRLAPHRRGEKLPDAVLATAPDARPQLVLEFGGAYHTARLAAFHHDCEQQMLPYEIW